uniref:Ig-like domain-containing protein n=1 Tax=Chrysemys picta bellii TaxID=8478 RepID=A0A8C3P269_CHRPI
MACLPPTAEVSYPKPSISLSPSGGVTVGGAVSVWCRGQRQGVRFVLNKEGRHFPPVDSDRFEAVFPISNVRREDGGSYSCSYHSRSEPFAVSYPSDPVELVVRGEEPGSSNPLLKAGPTPTKSSQPGLGQRWDVRFFLHKAGDLNPQRHMDPAGDGAGAEFCIPTVGRPHEGSYSCSYRLQSQPFVSSQPSVPVELVVAGEGPNSASPLPAGPPEGRHLMGCSQPGSAQSPRTGLDREWGQCHWGVPQLGGSSSSWRFRAQGGGIPAPRGIGVSAPPPTDAGSIPAGEIDQTQPGAAPDRVGPGTGAGGESIESQIMGQFPPVVAQGEGQRLFSGAVTPPHRRIWEGREASRSDTNPLLTGQPEAFYGCSWAHQWPWGGEAGGDLELHKKQPGAASMGGGIPG